MGPQLPFSEKLHAEKYRQKGESFKESMNRVANALSDNHQKDHFKRFRDILLYQRFMPGGRVQAAVGSAKSVTPYNCFVSSTIEDSFVAGVNCIMNCAKEAATTMRMGGGIGYDFSTLRPRGATIKKLMSSSSGPVSFMEIFNAICLCISSSGHRRGAQMGVLRVDHPDVLEFIHAKQPDKTAEPILEQLSKCGPNTPEWLAWYSALQAVFNLTGFNVSLAVTDEFMVSVKNDLDFNLKFDGQTYETISAQSLWDTIMRSTWDWAEPGVLFIDRINEMNNLHYCETIVATNPCGEQPLPPYGACLLGSFNLVKYISEDRKYFDWDLFQHDIPHVVRAMDKVVDVATYPLYEQEKEAKNKRRMGLGITGLANAGEVLGLTYGTTGFLDFEAEVLDNLNYYCYGSSCQLAKEKGSFPLFNKNKFLESRFVETLSDEIKGLIKKYGIRNSHLTSIAPTGTISMCADNVSSGIEPVFSYKQRRLVNMPTGQIETDFDDYGYRVFNVYGKRAEDVTVQEHVDVLVTAATRVDSAVSKTCNVPPTVPWTAFKDIYMQAWERGCKGITTYQTGGKRAGILKSADDEDGVACRIDPETGRRECE